MNRATGWPKVTIEVEPADPELNRRMKLFRRNGEWLSEHATEVYPRHLGKYIAVSEGKVFSSLDAQEAERLARQAHPSDEPFVLYVPKERAIRIYAC